MRTTTLKDYARDQNVSYEAIRKQIKRYSKELSGHIIRDGRQQMLDEVAVEFLNDKRQKNPVVVVQQDKDALIEQLQSETKELLLEVTKLQKEIIHSKEEKLLLSEKIATVELLEEKLQNYEDIAEINRQEAERAKAEAAALRSENERLKNRSFFARLFNRN